MSSTLLNNKTLIKRVYTNKECFNFTKSSYTVINEFCSLKRKDTLLIIIYNTIRVPRKFQHIMTLSLTLNFFFTIPLRLSDLV